MIDARFRIELPPEEWIAEVSRANPDATYRLLSGLRTGDRAVELGEVVAEDPAVAAAAVAEHPATVGFERLETAEDRVLSRYEVRDTGLYDLLERSSLPPEFPVVVRDGWYEFDLTGTREEFDRFRAELEESPLRYELLSVVTSERVTDLLTDRQREVLDTALRMGYFEIPRDCRLADLAAELDIDKSTASRTLRRGATRVLRWYLTGPEQAERHPRQR